MDAVAELGAEDVVDEPVLGDAAEPVERRRRHHGVEMVTVAGDLGLAPGIPASMRCLSSSGVADPVRATSHTKRSEATSLY